MARTAIPLYVTNQLVTAAHGNTYWRDNETANWVGTTAGDIDYYTGATAKARVAIGELGQGVVSNGTAPTWVGAYVVKTEFAIDRTLVAADAMALLILTGAVNKTVTVPLNAAVAFPVGTSIILTQDGAGKLTIAATGGVTIKNEVGLVLSGQYALAGLIKVDTDTWLAGGSLDAA